MLSYTTCIMSLKGRTHILPTKSQSPGPNVGNGAMGQNIKLKPPQDTCKTNSYPIGGGAFLTALTKLEIPGAAYVWSGRRKTMPKARVSKGPDTHPRHPGKIRH